MQLHTEQVELPIGGDGDDSEHQLMVKCDQMLAHQEVLEASGKSDQHEAQELADEATRQVHQLSFDAAALRAKTYLGLAAKAMFLANNCEADSDDVVHVLAKSLSLDILAMARRSR